MRFLDYLRKGRLYSESTINHYKTAIERWDKYLADKDEMADARDFVINLHEQGLNPATVNHIVSCLRAYCNYLVIFEGAASNPFNGIKSARTRKRLPMFITEDNICSIMARMPRGDWYQDMSYICVYTLFWTGLRVSELSNLRRDDITREYIKVNEGKGCKDRIVPMPDDVSDTIHDYMMRTSGTYLLEYQPNKPICTRSIRRIIDAALSDLPRQMRHPHMLRHSCATAMLKRGINIKSIATILGHASITTTEIYTHCDWQSLRDEYNKTLSTY